MTFRNTLFLSDVHFRGDVENHQRITRDDNNLLESRKILVFDTQEYAEVFHQGLMVTTYSPFSGEGSLSFQIFLIFISLYNIDLLNLHNDSNFIKNDCITCRIWKIRDI